MTADRQPFPGWILMLLGLSWAAAHDWMVQGWMTGSFLALVPFSLGVVRARRCWGASLFAFFGGLGLFLAAESFFGLVSRGGWVLLALWQAATLLPVAIALRWMDKAWHIPLAFALPVAWVGGEFLRNLGPMAMPTGMLMGPCFNQLWMIQICDLAGVYGGDCALGLCNGLLADIFLAWRDGQGGLKGNRSLRISCLAAVAVWLFIPAYGWLRLREAQNTVRPGPILAVVQPDIPYRAGIEHGFDPDAFVQEMLARSDQCLTVQPRAELVIWPEAMRTMPVLNWEWIHSNVRVPEPYGTQRQAARRTVDQLNEWVHRRTTPLLAGSMAWLPSPTPTNSWHTFNGAMLFTPDKAAPEIRQLKVRLFPGGEHIPWEGTWAGRILVWVLRLGDPTFVRSEIESGQRREIYGGLSSGQRHIINVCYEILFPDSSGVFLRAPNGGKAFDYLVNISNDGCFQRSMGQLMDWRALPFRAVEARVGIARAANSGISGFVKPTGEIYGVVTNATGQVRAGLGAPELPLIADVVRRRRHQEEILRDTGEYQRLTNDMARIRELRTAADVTGQSVQSVFTDSRRTVYSQIGDVLPAILLGVMMAGAAAGWRKKN